ncbi:hypothetical protein GCM10010387_46580 [Streptomyces inusitatus]|uniref:OmpR/PhoB-type domain-containing protein n=1 Tax=Streptomyces inusitatus TaxID=68221 RepID=A0A918QI22_9ACTN|nr:BTAD domain-containing putative transcriptional regulator [Streptomyces inusitatus]GGZ46806.1 hypothetical protein GCM10010387_46580 [Streptomyces inusitatus]
MQFRMLGPLEIADDCEGTVGLGGTKQRATLGYLLLHANRVVATSQLLNALWEVDDAPMTARKILQNAVYGLRGVLSAGYGRGERAATLLTQSPGYMIRVDPDQVDLHLFQRWVGQAREKQAQGAPESAARLLHDALALWRGPALADLVEAGIEWPELAAVQKARIDATEDYFDAQLACGRHHTILAELERMVQTEPLRERSCGQLMLALYRCGRQADALNVYGRVRSALVEDLGLEPGRGLQRLQQAILTQEATLSLEPGRGALPATDGPDGPVPARGPARLAPADPARGPGAPGAGEPAARPPAVRDAPAHRTGTERRRVGVVSVRTRLAPTLGGGGHEDLDDLLDGAASVVREQIERFGGTVTASIGSTFLALFGLDGPGDEDAWQAVRAALAVRDVLDVSGGHGSDGGGLSVCASVDLGEVLLRQRGPADPPTVVGAVLDASQELLSDADVGEVRVSDAVRRAVEDTFVCVPTEPSETMAWQVIGTGETHSGVRGAEASNRACELDFLQELVRRTRRRSVPHLVTLLGESGAGKTRLLGDLGHRITVQPEPVRCLTGRTPATSDDRPLLAQAQILASYCGVRAGDGAPEARAALTRAVRSLFPSVPTASRLLTQLAPLIEPAGESEDPRCALAAWRDFFHEAARRAPLVLCLDDLHRADDVVLEAVEELAEATEACLVVVAAAAPELLLRRPTWAGGKGHATTVTLDRLERITHEKLVEFLLSAAGSERAQAHG